jgi:hypothetical protein
MDAEVLLSSLLILLGLGSENESGQSQQKQNNLTIIFLNQSIETSKNCVK